jgi:primary-amine oxidase
MYVNESCRVYQTDVKAIVNSGTNGTISDYLIGPLPISSKTSFRPLSEIYHNPIPLNARATFNWTVLGMYVKEHVGPMDIVLADLFGGSVMNETILPAGVAPMSYDGTWRRTWLQLRRMMPGNWIRPLDFFIYVCMIRPSMFASND